jgi:predicted transglutaminase-like cysteine proteinase
MKMKKLMVPIILVLIFSGCNLMVQEFTPEDWNVTFTLKNTELLNMEQFTSPDDVLYFVHSAISYKSEKELYGHKVYWADPTETWGNRAGLCIDQTIFLMYIEVALGMLSSKEITLVGINTQKGIGHAVMKYNDKVYDPTIGVIMDYQEYMNMHKFILYYELNYGQVMYIVTHGHMQEG